jgi:hypothetical protein
MRCSTRSFPRAYTAESVAEVAPESVDADTPTYVKFQVSGIKVLWNFLGHISASAGI